MNERIQKYKAEYEKNEKKVLALQDKSKKLLAKITQLENEEIIGLVRESRLDIEGLSRLLARNEKHFVNYNDTEEKDDEIKE